MRVLAIGIAIAVLVFVVSGGHFFLSLLFLPRGLFSFGHRRQRWWTLPAPRQRFRWF
jgi:hypothetical protein